MILPDRRVIGGVNARSTEVDGPLILFHFMRTQRIPMEIKTSTNEDNAIMTIVLAFIFEFLFTGTYAVKGF